MKRRQVSLIDSRILLCSPLLAEQAASQLMSLPLPRLAEIEFLKFDNQWDSAHSQRVLSFFHCHGLLFHGLSVIVSLHFSIVSFWCSTIDLKSYYRLYGLVFLLEPISNV